MRNTQALSEELQNGSEMRNTWLLFDQKYKIRLEMLGSCPRKHKVDLRWEIPNSCLPEDIQSVFKIWNNRLSPEQIQIGFEIRNTGPLSEEIQSGFEMRNSLLLSEWQGMTLGLEGRHLHWNAPGTYKHLNSFIELYWQKNESECSICHNRKKGRSRVVFFVDWDIVHKC